MKRRFRYDKQQDRLVEIPVDDHPEDQYMVQGDIPAFRSPLDGTIVEGRAAYNEHMRKHNVVPFEQGSEKVRPPAPDRKPLREYLWEKVDRVSRGHKAQD